jgi:hypothetical protein
MNRKLSTAALTLSTFLVATGCAQVESDDVKTDGIYANLQVEATGNGSSVATASLKVGGSTSNTFLDLSPGDSLVAQSGADSADMVRNETLGAIWYSAVFATDSANTPFKISFVRDVEVSAPDSDVTLPAGFAITGPAADSSYSRSADAVVVTWDGSGAADPFSWQITGNCIVAQFGQQTADSGTLTIPAGAIQPGQNQGAASCQATIQLFRSRAGTLDGAYGEGGSVTARQTRSISILSAP